MTLGFATKHIVWLVGLVVVSSWSGCAEIASAVDQETHYTALAPELAMELDEDAIPKYTNLAALEAVPSLIIYKDFIVWHNENRDEVVLQGEPFNMTPGVDYAVLPTAALVEGVPSGAEMVLITSNSKGWASTAFNVNNDKAQQQLDMFVQGGGTLVVHMADVLTEEYGFRAPGIHDPAADDGNDNPLHVAVSDHPFVRGPDGELGTEDDATEDSVQIPNLGCCAYHGSFSNGVLPGNATVLLNGSFGQPVYAEYTHGNGHVIAGTLTFEWGVDGLYGHNEQVLINHFWSALHPEEDDVPQDSDDDGVDDDLDACPGTHIPEGVPTDHLGVNRFAVVDDSGWFTTNPPNGNGPQNEFSLADTAGCSCEQIIENLGLGNGHRKFGCSIGAMQNWVAQVN